jgi:TrmH family RNA methyltransferase
MFYPSQLSSQKLKQIRKLKQKKFRNQTDSFLCEGFRLFETAIDSSGPAIIDLIISENFRKSAQGDWALKEAEKKDIAVYVTNDAGMKSLSEDVTPPGIIFTAGKKIKAPISVGNLKDNTILYLEKISEPGNLGTIIRSACWFGIKSVLLSPECVDPWNSKSVRASTGAIFKTNIYTDVTYSILKKLFKNKKYNFIATVVSGGIPLNKWKIDQKNILFFGQEASGLSKEIIKDADVHINIPGYGNIESLNIAVAASIIVYETTKSGKDD